MVTLNPAKLLHIDHKLVLLKGKDADLVIWDDNPLNAQVVATYVEGRCLFSLERIWNLEKN